MSYFKAEKRFDETGAPWIDLQMGDLPYWLEAGEAEHWVSDLEHRMKINDGSSNMIPIVDSGYSVVPEDARRLIRVLKGALYS